MAASSAVSRSAGHVPAAGQKVHHSPALTGANASSVATAARFRSPVQSSRSMTEMVSDRIGPSRCGARGCTIVSTRVWTPWAAIVISAPSP